MCDFCSLAVKFILLVVKYFDWNWGNNEIIYTILVRVKKREKTREIFWKIWVNYQINQRNFKKKKLFKTFCFENLTLILIQNLIPKKRKYFLDSKFEKWSLYRIFCIFFFFSWLILAVIVTITTGKFDSEQTESDWFSSFSLQFTALQYNDKEQLCCLISPLEHLQCTFACKLFRVFSEQKVR